MKKVILSILLLVSIVNAFSQQTTQVKNKDYYLEKSKSKKTTAWILLGAGTASAVAGAIGFNENFDFFSDNGGGADAYGILFLGGVVADLVSIPFFTSAAHYKRLAADVTINYQNIYLPKQNTIALGKIPSLTIKIHFR